MSKKINWINERNALQSINGDWSWRVVWVDDTDLHEEADFEILVSDSPHGDFYHSSYATERTIEKQLRSRQGDLRKWRKVDLENE